VKSLTPHHHLGQETWLLRRFHGEKDRRKSESKKKIEKHSACIVCTEKDRRKCDSKKKIEKHSARIVCSEKMAMECRRVSTNVNGERELQWQADICRVWPSRTSGFSAFQVLRPIAGKAASRAAVCGASSFMCATYLFPSLLFTLMNHPNNTLSLAHRIMTLPLMLGKLKAQTSNR